MLSVTGSPVGVRIAAKMKIIKIAYLKFLTRNPGVATPILARKNTIVGS